MTSSDREPDALAPAELAAPGPPIRPSRASRPARRGVPSRAAGPARTVPAGLRANSLAALVMLVVQFWLGMAVDIYARLPAADHGEGLIGGFAAAVAHGPITLTLHALLGTLLAVTATTALVRSALARQPRLIAVAAIGLLAILAAWLSGAGFVGTQANGATLAMSLATGVALTGYAVILFFRD